MVWLNWSQQKKESTDVADHPNRHIREALKYADAQGRTLRKSSGRARAGDVVYCQFGHRQCWMSIYSTPRHPEGHVSIDFGTRAARSSGGTDHPASSLRGFNGMQFACLDGRHRWDALVTGTDTGLLRKC